MRIRLLTALLPTIVLTGCLQSTTIVKVNADGSGTLDNQTVMTAAALAQVRQLSGVLGGTNAKPFDPFSEEQARTFAGQMGDGVTLLSSMPVKTAAGEGRASVFGFRDVTKLRVSQAPATPGDTSIRGGGLGLGGDQSNSTLTIDLDSHARGQRPAHAAHGWRSADRAAQSSGVAEPGRAGAPRSDGHDPADARRHALSLSASNRWDDWSEPTARTSTARP